ncbi:hypothetical protein D3C86_1494440 [compost metagenome]
MNIGHFLGPKKDFIQPLADVIYDVLIAVFLQKIFLMQNLPVTLSASRSHRRPKRRKNVGQVPFNVDFAARFGLVILDT